jgi:hypothetical protein
METPPYALFLILATNVSATRVASSPYFSLQLRGNFVECGSERISSADLWTISAKPASPFELFHSHLVGDFLSDKGCFIKHLVSDIP